MKITIGSLHSEIRLDSQNSFSSKYWSILKFQIEGFNSNRHIIVNTIHNLLNPIWRRQLFKILYHLFFPDLEFLFLQSFIPLTIFSQTWNTDFWNSTYSEINAFNNHFWLLWLIIQRHLYFNWDIYIDCDWTNLSIGNVHRQWKIEQCLFLNG